MCTYLRENIFVGTGFQGWYIFQHLSDYETNCKPFVNIIEHEEWVEFKLK